MISGDPLGSLAVATTFRYGFEGPAHHAMSLLGCPNLEDLERVRRQVEPESVEAVVAATASPADSARKIR